MSEKKVVVSKNGPYVVSGSLPLSKESIVGDENNEPFNWRKDHEFPAQEEYSLCRCGHSTDKPYCSGMHRAIGFDGTEVATHEKYENQAEITEGPEVNLHDVKKLCSSASFCGRLKGTWEYTKDSGNPESKKLAIEQACNCPSGRLVMHDNASKQPMEPKFDPSISVSEDLVNKVSGPIRLKGGVKLETADGVVYEARNRMTVCRCGKSKNKPFCDGTHIEVKFRDGLKD